MKIIHVLLVEDNLADIELVREALDATPLKHQLHVVRDFEEARRYIESIPQERLCPDIVLMDLNLPKGSGFDLLRIVRSHLQCEELPVIVVSSSNAPRDREQAAQLGAQHYFRKPADLEEFMKLGPLVMRSLPAQAHG